MYAHLLNAPSDVLLHPDAGVWVVRTSFLTPTRQTQGGFRFSSEIAPSEAVAGPV